VHVLGDREFGDVVSEQGELRLDAPAPPRGIFASHPPDQLANLGVEPWPADRLGSRLRPPVELEASAAPNQNGGGLHDSQTGPPPHPNAGQPDPEDPVPAGQMGSAHRALEDQELVAQRQVLEGDGRRAEEQSADERPETDHEDHAVTRHQASRLRRDSTGSAVEVVREVRAAQARRSS
jgi:hypothetical protein